MHTEDLRRPEQTRRAGLRARLRHAVLSSAESPERIAGAIALGAFFGFSPFLGLQTLFAMSIAWVTRLSLPLVFLGLNLNLPWILPPYYAGVTLAARRWLGGDTCTGERLSQMLSHSVTSREFWNTALDASMGCAKPFAVGSVLGAAVVGLAVYGVSLAIVRSARG